jgi:hypothetical protein
MNHPLDGLGMGDDFSSQNILPDSKQVVGDSFGYYYGEDESLEGIGDFLKKIGGGIKSVAKAVAAPFRGKSKPAPAKSQAAQPSKAVNPQTSVTVAPKSSAGTVVSSGAPLALTQSAPAAVPQGGVSIEHPLAYMSNRPLGSFEGKFSPWKHRKAKSHHMSGVDFGWGDEGELGSILSDITGGAKTALSTAKKNITTAAKTGVTTLVKTGSLSKAKAATVTTAKSGVSQAIDAGIAKTSSGAAVQQTVKDAAAITAYEQGKAAAAKGGALVKETLAKAGTFIKDNKKTILLVGGGLAALYFFMKMKKKTRTA